MMPDVIWPGSSPIQEGEPLAAGISGGTANVPGIFLYSPGLSHLPPRGICSVSVTFSPADPAHYLSASTVLFVEVE